MLARMYYVGWIPVLIGNILWLISYFGSQNVIFAFNVEALSFAVICTLIALYRREVIIASASGALFVLLYIWNDKSYIPGVALGLMAVTLIYFSLPLKPRPLRAPTTGE